MLKAIVSYSKKVPVPDADFSSQGYSLALETEIGETQPAAIQAKLHQTFELVKTAVEDELANGNGHTAKPPETGTVPVRKPMAVVDKPATNRQIQYITSLISQ